MPEIANRSKPRETGGKPKGRIITVGVITFAMGQLIRNADIYQRVPALLAHNVFTANSSGTFDGNARSC